LPSGRDLVVVGRVGRPHGLDGSFFVEDGSADAERFQLGATLYVRGKPARVLGSKRSGGRPVIRLDTAVSRGEELSVPRSELPELEEEGAFYVFELVGLEVVEDGGRSLGRVRDVVPGVANDVLELESGLSLPMHEECVLRVDLGSGTIVVAPGYIEPD
jgi:16S rRNA processing protein RimM